MVRAARTTSDASGRQAASRFGVRHRHELRDPRHGCVEVVEQRVLDAVAELGAPTPPKGQPSSTVTTRWVFFTIRATVSMSSGPAS